MEIYLIIGVILLLLSIITPIASLIIYVRYINDADYIFTIVIINIIIIALLWIIGFNCIIRSHLIFS